MGAGGERLHGSRKKSDLSGGKHSIKVGEKKNNGGRVKEIGK